MKVINPLATQVSQSNLIRAERQNEEKSRISSEQNSSNENDRFSVTQNNRVRVIKVADTGLDIQEFSSEQTDKNENLTQRRNPANQYSFNQSIPGREELRQSIGVDIFV